MRPRLRLTTYALSALLALPLASCGDAESGTDTPDAGPDSVGDVVADIRFDTTPDALDLGDTGVADVGSDGAEDVTTTDSTPDTTPDARPDADTGAPDAPPDALGDAPDAFDASDAPDVRDARDADTGAPDASDASDASDAADAADVAPTGPQLVSSSVTHGEIGAPRSSTVTLRFDRPIPVENLVDTLFATSERNPAPVPMFALPCADDPSDRACVAARFDFVFVDFVSGELQPATYHTIVISRELADADGNTNDEDTIIRFSTEGSLVLYDGTATGREASGLAYDQDTRSLFFTDVTPSLDGSTPVVVHRIRNPDGPVELPTAFAVVNPVFQATWFTELDASGGRLYLSMPYDASVRVFDDLRFDGARASELIMGTSLPEPDASLRQVSSTAALDGGARYLFGFGSYLATTRPTAVFELEEDVWSRFAPGAYSTALDFFVAAREDAAPGVVFVSAENELVVLSAETGERLNAQPFGGGPVVGRMQIDSAGRLYAPPYGGGPLWAFDTSGSDGFTHLGTFDVGGRDRFAIGERGNVLTVYSMSYRNLPLVVRQRYILCDGAEPCVSSCDDGVLDGSESAVDCGGTCDPCPLEATCGADLDCASGNCDEGVCAPPPPNGCADGTREGFVDVRLAPDIAGCSGAWSVPGVVGSTEPSCDRMGGNDGVRRDGVGCGAVDLCAEGWHVCESPEEVAFHAPNGTCEAATRPGDPPRFFATAVRSGGAGACMASPIFPDHANDLFGCGNFGAAPPGAESCAPLDRFSGDLCAALLEIPGLTSWQCGSDGLREATAVTRADEFGGGVLCCAP